MADVDPTLEQTLRTLEQSFPDAFANAQNEAELRQARARFLGKKGIVAELLRQLASLPPEQRKTVGQAINEKKRAIELAFEKRLAALAVQQKQRELHDRPFDLTLPARHALPPGHPHPLVTVMRDVLGIFRDLGFSVLDGPEVELEANNFDKLGFPPDHPATDMQDTFWVEVTGAEPGARTLLRTHTSSVQIRAMSAYRPPLAVVSAGAVYRRDDDVTHSPMFHQIEGFLVDRNVTFAHLKGVLVAFAERLYGPGTQTRFRPSYFPFVEPGAEVDIACVFCRQQGCRICKSTGWLEVLGCGMIHPVVFENTGIDPDTYTGFAFGLGVERIAMLRYGIPDIRVLFENDPRFLSQFPHGPS